MSFSPRRGKYDPVSYDDGPRQMATKFPANALCAERCQVEDSFWWETVGQDARVVVQCTHRDQYVFRYPSAALSQLKRHRVNPVDDFFEDELNAIMDDVYDALAAGFDVVFHCEHSFHRGPLVGAAVHKRLTGVTCQVSFWNLRTL